jgi:glycosyltransferase involved in cell wall biosynthesis
MLTYNREKLVSRAIESILNQSFTDFEYIIADNGSTDRSGIIADEYAAKDPRINVIHRTRGNIGAGRNTGLDVARGKYIVFIDDDDWCEIDFLEFLHNLLIKSNADVAICGTPNYIFDEKCIMSAEEAIIRLMWRKHYTAAFPAKMFRREVMKNLRFPESGEFDDIGMMYLLLGTANRVAYHGLPKYTFYRHDHNNSIWTSSHNLLTPKILDEYLYAYRERTLWLNKKFPRNANLWEYFEWSFMISMVEKINRLGIEGCNEQCESMLRELRENRKEFLSCEWIQEFEKEWMENYLGKAAIV